MAPGKSIHIPPSARYHERRYARNWYTIAVPTQHREAPLSNSMTRQEFPEGSVIFVEGHPGDTAYLIESGKVEISAVCRSERLVVATMSEGDMFGEMALLDNRVRSATATALTHTVVIPIHRDHLLERYRTTDPLIKLFIQLILQRFRATQHQAWGGDADDPANQTRFIFEGAQKNAIGEIKLRRDLQLGLDRSEFRLFHQPIVSLPSGRIVGFEALIRWRRPEQGIVSPGQFIALAEKTGLIVPIGRWVLQQACRDLTVLQHRRRRSQGDGRPLFMSINLSPIQIRNTDEVHRLTGLIRDSGLDSTTIKLEVTESLLLENPEQASAALSVLKSSGAQLALDDFGTGYSSLSYLHRFPFDTLKIDRSFIHTMSSEPNTMKIVRAMASLAQALGMDIVAEGIEHAEEINHLHGCGYTLGQGFYFSRPVPLQEALQLVQTTTP